MGGEFDEIDSYVRKLRRIALAAFLVAVIVAVLAYLSVREAHADPLTLAPPCNDWRVSSLKAGGGTLYCGSDGRVWMTLDAKCTWQAARDQRRTTLEPIGRLVLTCAVGPCAGMQLEIYPRRI